jgi:phosphatidylserine/phosphatidylglycerophosphate/cardiolipin synthase-like enzyme
MRNILKFFSLLILSLNIASCSNSFDLLDELQENSFEVLNKIPTVRDTDPNFLTFFSNTYNSVDPSIAKNFEDNPDKQFIKLINETKRTLDICAFHIDSETITDAIISAHKRKVIVRIVIDSDTKNTSSVKRIIDSGIPVVEDNRNSLMHNKFAISDSETVWTGSFNFTDNASWKHCDNSIKIKNKYLAKNFIAEFEEMFLDKKFGRQSVQNMRNRIVRIGNKYVKTFFAPEDDVPGAIINEIKKANKEIKFLSYSFTHTKIAEAILEKKKSGIKVSGIFEYTGSNTSYSEYKNLLNAGITLYRYKSIDNSKSFMHHKVIIIDNKIVITGSFNFTNNASTDNDENLLVITSHETAARYNEEFERVKNACELTILQ